MSHNSIVILVVRPLWGRSHVDALPPRVKTRGSFSASLRKRQSRATIVCPLWGPSSIHRGPSSIHLCAIKYIITKKVVPCCLGCLFKNKWCYLKQLKQQGTTYRTIGQRLLDLQHGSNLVARGRECDDKTFGRLAGFHIAITKECNAADLATIGVAFAQ